MNLTELHTILEATGIPVAYSHFEETDTEPIPNPPIICYWVTYSSNFSADNIVFKQILNVQIELYTDKKDLTTESLIESKLNQYELPFMTTETYIPSEDLFQKIYEMRLI